MQFDKQKILEILASPIMAWFILGLFMLFFAIISIILVYHWKRYGFKSKQIAFAEVVYFPVALLFIGMAIFSLIMYSAI